MFDYPLTRVRTSQQQVLAATIQRSTHITRFDVLEQTMKVFYCDDYVAMAHSIDATKKPQWIAESLARKPIPNVEMINQFLPPRMTCSAPTIGSMSPL